jgi:two-component system cell cycle sensor histidine kinase/response regulator CckA
VALTFQGLSPEAEDLIQDLVLEHLQQASALRAPSVLVVDGSPEARQTLAQAIQALGQHVVTAASPLEALQILADDDQSLRVALVELFLGQNDGLDLLCYLEQVRPRMRRVLMSGQVRPCQLRLALRHHRIHAVLSKPWTQAALVEALQQQP